MLVWALVLLCATSAGEAPLVLVLHGGDGHHSLGGSGGGISCHGHVRQPAETEFLGRVVVFSPVGWTVLAYSHPAKCSMYCGHGASLPLLPTTSRMWTPRI